MMRIVHHSNYLRWAEEARVAWGFATGLLSAAAPEKAAQLAVIETQVRHLKPCQFGDQIFIELQARREGIQIVFEYKIWKQIPNQNENQRLLASEVRTKHVALDSEQKLLRPSEDMRKILEKETWIETWLSSL